MKKINMFLQQSTPPIRNRGMLILVSALIVVFILGFFQPFGLNHVASPFKWLFIAGYGLISIAGTSVICYIFPLLFPRFYNPEQWTVGKSLINTISLLLIISVGNSLYDWSFNSRPTETFIPVLFSYILITFLVGFFPAIIIFYVTQTNELKRNLRDAAEMNKRLLDHLNNTAPVVDERKETIILSGNTKESIELSPDELLYIEASGNYVRICYLVDETVKHKLLRATIAQMEKELEAQSTIVRCHRAYMVNIDQILKIDGNSQGFQLSMRHLKEGIPVSRSYTSTIRSRIN